MKKSLLLIPFVSLFFGSCNKPSGKITDTADKSAKLGLNAKYFETQAGAKAEIVAPGIISKQYNERDFALSPDGKELYFTVVAPKNYFQAIFVMRKGENGWGAPETASFSGRFPDIEPTFSADGQKMFFASKRPLDGQGELKDWDIWYVEKKDGQWSVPKNAGDKVNTQADEFYPSVAKNGNLYFTAQYDYGVGREDIFMSKLEGGEYQKPEPLSEGVNSKTYEFNAFVDPDERYILFTSYGRKSDLGGGDLYISFKTEEGQWGDAVHLPEGINSKAIDYCPFVDFQQKNFYFTSETPKELKSYPKALSAEEVLQSFDETENGLGNIYRIDAKGILKLKQER